MVQYVDKSALVAEIERKYETNLIGAHSAFRNGKIEALREVKDFLNTLEVKDANEALRTEYEKGRADVIADTLSWLENCWPRYCYNHTIIDAYKEGVVKD